jgi:two-component system response regulator
MSDGIILLVEDNADEVLFTLRAFAKNKIDNQIVVAADGEQALEYLLPTGPRPPLRPALTLLDINLPKIDGLEVLRRVRADPRTHALPVVVLTTSNEERDILESYRLGANSYVRKPVVLDEFLLAAELLGTYWLRVNEPVPASVERVTGRA